MLSIFEHRELLLTHGITPAGPIPTVQQADSCYPYESFSETDNRPQLRYHKMVTLENDQLRVTVCPDLGGKVYAMVHKRSGKHALFCEPIVRPIRILPRQFYIGGGIEVSFPISHTPTQVEPLLYQIERRDNRVFCWCGETEIKFGMHFTVEYSLGERDCFLTQRTYFDNPTGTAHPWMSWSNAGVPVFPDTQLHYPGGRVLEHGTKLHTIDWRTQGPKTQADIEMMTGWFWREPDCHAFGAFSPSYGCGLYHVAEPEQMPGIKLWSDGVGEHTAFVSQWTLSKAQCLEIQAGPLVDQGVKHLLEPGSTHCHTEFWIPTDVPLDIYDLCPPQVTLPPEADIPHFGYARPRETALWDAVLEAWRQDKAALLPSAPGLDSNAWPPSGMEQLDLALGWAAGHAPGWRFYEGVLLGALERNDEAIEQLLASGDDRGFVLAARLLRRGGGDCKRALDVIAQVKSEALALHPQVIFERDKILEALGPDHLEQREYWLERCAGLQDEWLIERRASVLIARGRFAEAKALLEQTPFQLVHQRYVRLPLWRQVEQGLDLEPKNQLNWMGEDTLAEFGQYQEYTGE